MFAGTSYVNSVSDLQQFAIWLVTLFLVAFGFRYVKDVITLILGKLYEFFIQHHAIDL